jgi:hypothetical protein
MAFPDRRTLNVLMTALLFGLVLAIVQHLQQQSAQ